MSRAIARPVEIASVKPKIRQFLTDIRLKTGSLRVSPDFIIIGGQRCGTTSLYNTLVGNLGIAPALKKEVHFFDINFNKGMSWYKAHFPTYLYKFGQRASRRTFITGEATPYYLFHPNVPGRVAASFPRIKLIAMLRNPVDRAYSHYHHEVRKGFEHLSFEEAIEREQERLSGEISKMQTDENYFSFNHRHFSYLSRGVYVDQLRAWRTFFPEEQILVLRSEDFYSDSRATLRKIFDFLKMPAWRLSDQADYPAYPYSRMNADVRKYLTDYFRPHNQELYEYLGVDLGWDR